jgi:ATP-dependent DNA ligase
VSYDQLTGDRFRHATRFRRWRPDKDPVECTMEQLERPDGPGFADVVVDPG